MKYIIDSYAWVEYLEGSKLGEKVREIINDKDKEIFSLNLTIAEIVSKVKRKKGNTDTAYNAIVANSKIKEITPSIARRAGLFHAEIRAKIKNFGLADALILILAREIDAKILTSDEHFRGFKEAIFL